MFGTFGEFNFDLFGLVEKSTTEAKCPTLLSTLKFLTPR